MRNINQSLGASLDNNIINRNLQSECLINSLSGLEKSINITINGDVEVWDLGLGLQQSLSDNLSNLGVRSIIERVNTLVSPSWSRGGLRLIRLGLSRGLLGLSLSIELGLVEVGDVRSNDSAIWSTSCSDSLQRDSTLAGDVLGQGACENSGSS